MHVVWLAGLQAYDEQRVCGAQASALSALWSPLLGRSRGHRIDQFATDTGVMNTSEILAREMVSLDGLVATRASRASAEHLERAREYIATARYMLTRHEWTYQRMLVGVARRHLLMTGEAA